MSAPELSRPVKPRALPAGPLTVDAGETERAALAARFGVTAIPALTATVDFGTKGAADRPDVERLGVGLGGVQGHGIVLIDI